MGFFFHLFIQCYMCLTINYLMKYRHVKNIEERKEGCAKEKLLKKRARMPSVIFFHEKGFFF